MDAGLDRSRCIKGRMPCRACFGPIRKDANPMVEMSGMDERTRQRLFQPFFSNKSSKGTGPGAPGDAEDRP